MAHQLVRLRFEDLIEHELDRAAFDIPAARDVCRVGLANYAAAEARLLCRKPSTEFERLLGYTAEAEMVHRDNLVLSAV